MDVTSLPGWLFFHHKGRGGHMTQRFRLGVYDSCDDTIPVQYVGRVFDGSDYDRDVMQCAIYEYNSMMAARQGCTYTMAVFRDSNRDAKTQNPVETSVK
jgi:hypothetical protein